VRLRRQRLDSNRESWSDRMHGVLFCVALTSFFGYTVQRRGPVLLERLFWGYLELAAEPRCSLVDKGVFFFLAQNGLGNGKTGPNDVMRRFLPLFPFLSVAVSGLAPGLEWVGGSGVWFLKNLMAGPEEVGRVGLSGTGV